jgi:hypothetical protein
MLPLGWGVGVPRVVEARVVEARVVEARLVRTECITLLISSPSLGQPLRKAFD